MFIATVWIRAEPSFEEWVQILDIYVYYVGIYILIAAAVIVMIVSFLGCCSALMEHTKGLFLVRVFIYYYRNQSLVYTLGYIERYNVIHISRTSQIAICMTMYSTIYTFKCKTVRVWAGSE